MSDLSDLNNLLISHNSDSYIEIWTEDWGTDNDIDKDYVSLLKLFEKKSKGSMKLANLKSSSNGEHVQISFSVNDSLYEWEFDQIFDHFSEDFEEHFLDLQKSLLDKRFVYLSGGDMPQFVLLPKDVVNLLLGYGISGETESSSINLAGGEILDLINFTKTNRLTALDLSEKGVSQIPKEIGLLTDLEELSLSFNELQEIPEEIGNLANLKILKLHGNTLANLPLTLKKLQKLEELTLGGNTFKEIPATVYELFALKRLAFPANKVKSISKDIRN
ncbi:MAG: leucine-rich repeat domain-containing protein [Deltaproteobacteria bacterium]|nr:leucine-rich repeat domain-containing protein [Deltaproteobacteria bacterium]